MNSARDPADARYVHVTQRLNAVTGACALGIHALTALSVHANQRSLAWVGGCVLTTLPINLWITAVLLKRRGPAVAEMTRLVVNVAACLIQNPAIGWPLPVWLWLPYVAVSFDGYKPRTIWAAVLAMCVANGIMAVHDGVFWLYPLTFTGLAAFCRFVAEKRLAVIRDMLAQSDEQRRALDQAHASLQSAHERLKNALEERDRVELELRHAQKLEAVGRLAAGVAHEINTPLQFVNDSVQFVREAMADVLGLVERYRCVCRAAADAMPDAMAEMTAAEEAADWKYLTLRLPDALARSVEGLDRVATIVRGLRAFAHPDRKEKSPADLNEALQTTLAIARSAYKYVADIRVDLGKLPLVSCHVGELNQAFLNIVVNAAQAIEQAVRGSDARGVISVRTWTERGEAFVSVHDTGGGIPEAVRSRVFDPFFTTKELGQGTGQGLAIARSIVVDKHQGALTFDTASGEGTTFVVRLPVEPPRSESRAA